MIGGALGGNYGLTPAYSNWWSYGGGDGGAAIYNDGSGFKSLMVVGNNSAGGPRQVGVWDDLTVSGKIYLGGVGRNTWPSLGAQQNAQVVGWVPAPWSGVHSGDCPAGFVATGAEVDMRGTCGNHCGPDGPIWGSLILHCRSLQ